MKSSYSFRSPFLKAKFGTCDDEPRLPLVRALFQLICLTKNARILEFKKMSLWWGSLLMPKKENGPGMGGGGVGWGEMMTFVVIWYFFFLTCGDPSGKDKEREKEREIYIYINNFLDYIGRSINVCEDSDLIIYSIFAAAFLLTIKRFILQTAYSSNNLLWGSLLEEKIDPDMLWPRPRCLAAIVHLIVATCPLWSYL